MRYSRLLAGIFGLLVVAACSESPTELPDTFIAPPSLSVATDGALTDGGMLIATTGLFSTTPSILKEIDPVTGAVIREIGPVGYVVSGMEFDHTSKTLYGSVKWDPNFEGLITIDLETGAGTPVGVDGWGLGADNDIEAITVDSYGNLFGWLGFFPQQVVSIDKATGVATIVGPRLPFGTLSFPGLDFSAWDELFLVNGDRDGGIGDVWSVDPVLGEGGRVGNLGGVMARHGDFHPQTDYYYGITGDVFFLTRELAIVDVATRTVLETVPGLPDDIDVVTFVPPLGPTTLDDCKDDRWMAYGFRNQGLCVRFVNTGK